MKRRANLFVPGLIASALAAAHPVRAQEPSAPPEAHREAPPAADAARPGAPRFDGPPGFGPGGAPPFGPGGPMMLDQKLVEKFDADGDGRLDAAERKAAREFLAKERAEGRGRRGPFGRPGGAPSGPSGPGGGFPMPFGRRENQAPPEPGRKLTPADVQTYPSASLYDPQILRTLFFEFEDADWEKELMDFHRTDVEVPAKLTVDGKAYPDAGVHFHGMSSFMMVGEGRKHSMAVSLDFVHGKQTLGGYRALDLLNSHEDPSFLRAVLYCRIAREYLPAPQANLVRVVINGESWGVYVNKQHFNKDFLREWFGETGGTRWKAPGSPMARAGLEYTGEDPAEYRKRFEIKSKDKPEAWTRLIRLCRVLNETPAEQLEEKLGPILDIDGALRFLALDNALINGDGYWVRSSDYALYEDEGGRFHILPHDVNEAFSLPGGGPPGFPGGGPGGRPGGPRPGDARETRAAGKDAPGAGEGERRPDGPGGFRGFPRGPQIKGVELDPLHSANDASKPLLSKLLAVPALRERYLGYVKDIAEKWLDWDRLGPIARQYAAIVADDVKADTRKLESTEAFERSVEGGPGEGGAQEGPHREISLKRFAEQRRAYLLSCPAIQALQSKTANR